MLGELGFQGTMTGKSGTNHKFDLQVEVANLSIYMCCMPRSANIKSCVIPSSPPWRFWNSEAFCHWTAGSLQWPGEHGNERHASNVEMDDKVRWELRMLCYDFVVLAIWSTWISVHFLPRIFPKFWILTLTGGSWRGAVQEMINPKEPIHAAKKKFTIFNGPFWVISGDVTLNPKGSWIWQS